MKGTASLVDTHAHLDVDDFAPDRDEVIARAVANGVDTIITVGTNVNSSRFAVRLAEHYPQVYAAVGIHPHDAGEAQKADIARLAEMAEHPRVVAFGEMGLDFYRNYSPREAQLQVLHRQLEMAAQLRRPVILHARQAAPEMVALLANWIKRYQPVPRGVVHCFSGDMPTARKYLDLGFYLSFAGYVTYPNNRTLQMVKQLPHDRVLVETDCPFITPQPRRGQRNEPAYTALTARALAGATGMSMEAFSRLTTQNARHLFQFS